MSEITPLFALEAEKLLNEGFADLAAGLCERGLEEYPDYPAALAVLSQAYEALGKSEDAEEKKLSANKSQLPTARNIESIHNVISQSANDEAEIQNKNISTAAGQSNLLNPISFSDHLDNDESENDDFSSQLGILPGDENENSVESFTDLGSFSRDFDKPIEAPTIMIADDDELTGGTSDDEEIVDDDFDDFLSLFEEESRKLETESEQLPELEISDLPEENFDYRNEDIAELIGDLGIDSENDEKKYDFSLKNENIPDEEDLLADFDFDEFTEEIISESIDNDDVEEETVVNHDNETIGALVIEETQESSSDEINEFTEFEEISEELTDISSPLAEETYLAPNETMTSIEETGEELSGFVPELNDSGENEAVHETRPDEFAIDPELAEHHDKLIHHAITLTTQPHEGRRKVQIDHINDENNSDEPTDEPDDFQSEIITPENSISTGESQLLDHLKSLSKPINHISETEKKLALELGLDLDNGQTLLPLKKLRKKIYTQSQYSTHMAIERMSVELEHYLTGSDEESAEKVEKPVMITETIAKILASQGSVIEAIDAYRHLALEFPDRKEYFIQKANELITVWF